MGAKMKVIEYLYTVHADISLTHEEVLTIIECAKAHYDYKCNASTRQGGFVFGWNNTVGLGEATVKCTRDMADTVCKSLEMPIPSPTRDALITQFKMLVNRLDNMCYEANE